MTGRVKKLLAVTGLILLGGSVYAFFSAREGDLAPTIVTAGVTLGDIVASVSATGTLQAVTSVQVGSQVSGTIRELGADFNSLVKRGQVLARLDPSLFETQVEQARANVVRAEADVERLEVGLQDARAKLARAQALAAQQILPQSELDAADVAVRSLQAQIQSAAAQVAQARATLGQGEVNLQHTVITAPIDGIVLSRSVDVGQTVAASMQAPTLFVLAADLTRMQVVADIDESDIGRVAPGQPVTFTVDAFPGETFTGTVAQVRLQPQTVQNVVTYATLIDAPNATLALKPGMTANITIEVARRDDVMRVPAAALRFVPEGESRQGATREPRVWRSDNGQLVAVPVESGLSDGQTTEIRGDSLQPGDLVAIRLSTPGQEVRPAATAFPLMQAPSGRGPGPR